MACVAWHMLQLDLMSGPSNPVFGCLAPVAEDLLVRLLDWSLVNPVESLGVGAPFWVVKGRRSTTLNDLPVDTSCSHAE